jgi:hypothetical protein
MKGMAPYLIQKTLLFSEVLNIPKKVTQTSEMIKKCKRTRPWVTLQCTNGLDISTRINVQ